jgi:ribosomal protein S18 acetylase RimI-like enzyme
MSDQPEADSTANQGSFNHFNSVPPEFSLQRLTEQHIEGALKLCRLAGWNQLAYDWRRLLKLEPLGCFAVSLKSKLVATVTNTRYGDNLAWIGMMLVHPDFRRQGLATMLVNKCLDFLRTSGTRCVKLDATPTGQKVYEKLGFEVEWPFRRWTLQRIPLNSQHVAGKVSPASQGSHDFPDQVCELDASAFGADRSELIRDLTPSTDVRFRGSGYGLLRPGYLADYLGPVVSGSLADAGDLIRELIDESPRTIFWDIPSPNDSAVRLAQSLGFQPGRDLIRMQIGRQAPTPDYSLQYAMFDPSVG